MLHSSICDFVINLQLTGSRAFNYSTEHYWILSF